MNDNEPTKRPRLAIWLIRTATYNFAIYAAIVLVFLLLGWLPGNLRGVAALSLLAGYWLMCCGLARLDEVPWQKDENGQKYRLRPKIFIARNFVATYPFWVVAVMFCFMRDWVPNSWAAPLMLSVPGGFVCVIACIFIGRMHRADIRTALPPG